MQVPMALIVLYCCTFSVDRLKSCVAMAVYCYSSEKEEIVAVKSRLLSIKTKIAQTSHIHAHLIIQKFLSQRFGPCEKYIQ